MNVRLRLYISVAQTQKYNAFVQVRVNVPQKFSINAQILNANVTAQVKANVLAKVNALVKANVNLKLFINVIQIQIFNLNAQVKVNVYQK